MELGEYLHWIALTIFGGLMYFFFDRRYLTLTQGAVLFLAATVAALLFSFRRRGDKGGEDGRPNIVGTRGGGGDQVAGGTGNSQSSGGSATGNTINQFFGTSSPPSLPPPPAIPPNDEPVEPPDIDIQAAGGKEAMVTLHNKGGPFMLKTRIRLSSADRPIDDGHLHDYRQRQIKGGDDYSRFQIATTGSMPHHVYIWGEFQDSIQHWDMDYFKATLSFAVEMTFQIIHPHRFETIGTWSIAFAYQLKEERFTQAIATRLR